MQRDANLDNLRRVDCEVVALALGLRSDRRRRFFCPFCQPDGGRDGDFSTPARGGWRCFKCGASGDALTLVRQRVGFDSAPDELARIVGRARTRTFNRAPRRVDVDRGVDVDRLLSRLPTQPALEWLVDARGFPSSVARLVESGATWLEPGSIAAEVPRWIVSFVEDAGPAICFPLRSAADNVIRGANLRSVASGERRAVGPHRDGDDTPRGYGFAGAALRADPLVLCEGAVDTLAAEAALRNADPRSVAVGAVCAGELLTWARFLAAKRCTGRVVIIRHLDGDDAFGAGQCAADDAMALLRAAGVRAEHFSWGALADALHAVGVALVHRRGFDLGDALLACSSAATFDTFRRALLGVLDVDAGVPA